MAQLSEGLPASEAGSRGPSLSLASVPQQTWTWLVPEEGISTPSLKLEKHQVQPFAFTSNTPTLLDATRTPTPLPQFHPNDNITKKILHHAGGPPNWGSSAAGTSISSVGEGISGQARAPAS